MTNKKLKIVLLEEVTFVIKLKKMDNSLLKDAGDRFVPSSYLTIAMNSRSSREKQFKLLIEQGKIPNNGWDDNLIEEFVNYISSLDSNNFLNQCGLGEREARIACKLVARRHYNFGHGIGRSGDLLEPQPKAAGSSLLSQLTNRLLLDLMRNLEMTRIKSCFLVPMATGMSLMLCFLSLKKQRPKAKYIIWSRIDQKSCFKCIITAGFNPIVIELKETDNGMLTTDLEMFEDKISNIPQDEILCIYSTSSCFAPRLCDDIVGLAKLAKKYNIPHVINNAYGLTSSYIVHQIQEGDRLGRIDLFVQSTDKNLLVPVGGAIIAGFNEDMVKCVAKTYAGRASSSQTLDVFMTLLSLGKSGYFRFVSEQKRAYEYLKEKLQDVAKKFDEEILYSKKNPMSIALTLKNLREHENVTRLGSMLFIRGVSGTRLITGQNKSKIDSYTFEGWGSHKNIPSYPYLTAAAGFGINRDEIDNFIEKLEKCLKKVSEEIKYKQENDYIPN